MERSEITKGFKYKSTLSLENYEVTSDQFTRGRTELVTVVNEWDEEDEMVVDMVMNSLRMGVYVRI